MGISYDVDLRSGHRDSSILLTAEVYKYVEKPGNNSASIVGEYGHLAVKPSGVSI